MRRRGRQEFIDALIRKGVHRWSRINAEFLWFEHCRVETAAEMAE